MNARLQSLHGMAAPSTRQQLRCATRACNRRRHKRCAILAQADAAPQAKADALQLKRDLQAAVEAEVRNLGVSLPPRLHAVVSLPAQPAALLLFGPFK